MYAAGTYSLSLILEFGAGPRICIYNSAQVTLMLLVIIYCDDDEKNNDGYDRDFSFT